jgi:hypothetical protein
MKDAKKYSKILMKEIYKHIQIGNGHSIADDSYSAGIEAATSAKESIAAFPISVVLVFASVRYNFSKLLKGVGSIVGKVPVIGSSTAGEIYNQPFNRSVVVVVLASPYIHVKRGIGKNVSANWERAVTEATDTDELQPFFSLNNEGIWQKILRQGLSVFAMIFSPGNTRYANSAGFEILARLKERSNNRIPFFDGCAADDWQMETNYIFHDSKAHPDSLLIVIFETSLKFGIAMAHGFIPSNQSAVATKVNGHEVLQFDGIRAADRYAQMLNYNPDELKNKHLTLTTSF